MPNEHLETAVLHVLSAVSFFYVCDILFITQNIHTHMCNIATHVFLFHVVYFCFAELL